MNLENEFMTWLKNETDLSESSISKYNGGVRTIGKYLSEEFDLDLNIFEINTESKFQEIVQLIHQSQKTLKRYSTGNGMYARAIKLYGEFLQWHELQVRQVQHLDTTDEDPLFEEGERKEVMVTVYERDSKARRKCIEVHGTRCKICGFSFEEVYGERFKDKIHVHHIKPLYEIGETYIVDPIHDLIPVCPNCHLIIHSKEPAYTPDEVRQFIINSR